MIYIITNTNKFNIKEITFEKTRDFYFSAIYPTFKKLFKLIFNKVNVINNRKVD